jgi:hypothetical protein
MCFLNLKLINLKFLKSIMKKSKKAIFGMLISMIISLGLFNSTVNKSDRSQDANLTQLGIAAIAYGYNNDNAGAIAAGGISTATGFSFGYYLLTGETVNCWNPAGWGCIAGGLIV